MSQSPFPCWLTKQQLIQADALIAQGFDFCGDADKFGIEEDIKVRKCGDWIFYSAVGEFVLIAVCCGAAYICSPESESEDGVQWFDDKLKASLAAIKKSLPKREDSFRQLTIFDFI